MARPKSFDRDDVLDRAVELFWSQGFDATSMSDVRRAMGIGRQSLYDTFGDKDQLFAEVLDRYLAWNDAALAEALPEGAGLDALRAFVVGVVDRVTSEEPRRGCLLMSTCGEVAGRDGEVSAHTERGLDAMTRTFTRVLRRAVEQGEVRADLDPVVAGRMVTATLAGVNLLAQSGASRESLVAVVDQALAGLR